MDERVEVRYCAAFMLREFNVDECRHIVGKGGSYCSRSIFSRYWQYSKIRGGGILYTCNRDVHIRIFGLDLGCTR